MDKKPETTGVGRIGGQPQGVVPSILVRQFEMKAYTYADDVPQDSQIARMCDIVRRVIGMYQGVKDGTSKDLP